VLLGLTGSAAAQVYPSRPITMIVPYPAGGGTDTIGRVVAEGMRVALGQPVIIENVGGASGSIGVTRGVRAPNDGYTFGLGNWGTHVVNGAAYSLKYDLLNDLEPLSLIETHPMLIIAKKGMPARDLREFIAWLKANPGKVLYAVTGAGGTSHVSGV